MSQLLMTVGVKSNIAAGPATLSVNPAATELDRWTPGRVDAWRITLENTDVAQTYQGWLEARPVSGSGTFSRLPATSWGDVGPLEARDDSSPPGATGAGELRFMATASGAGGNCIYARRDIMRG